MGMEGTSSEALAMPKYDQPYYLISDHTDKHYPARTVAYRASANVQTHAAPGTELHVRGGRCAASGYLLFGRGNDLQVPTA